ncbi:MAG: hypothetical protein HKM02_01200 [Pseudomonadales bacterium]|nr:hypothetical protein [Pseudomonadales bacterium]
MLPSFRTLWKKSGHSRLGLVLSTHSLSWVLIQPGAPPSILGSGAIMLNNRELGEVLLELLNTPGIANSQVHLVLPPGNYQLLLAEAPSVPETELADALRWKVADMLTYDPAEAALDAFALPEDAYRGRQPMAYVAACPRPLISSFDQVFARLPLALMRITIPEVASLHVGQRIVPESESWALVMLGINECHMCLMQHRELYLTRQAPVGWSRLRGTDDFDHLLLEIQRSLDYYESQIGKGTIRRVLISPHIKSAELATYLDQNMTPAVSVLDIQHLVQGELSGSAADEAVALGAALGSVE